MFGSPISEMLQRAMPDLNLSFVSQPMSAIKHMSDASIFKTIPVKPAEHGAIDEEQTEESGTCLHPRVHDPLTYVELDFTDLERKMNGLSPGNSGSDQREHERRRSSSHPPIYASDGDQVHALLHLRCYFKLVGPFFRQAARDSPYCPSPLPY